MTKLAQAQKHVKTYKACIAQTKKFKKFMLDSFDDVVYLDEDELKAWIERQDWEGKQLDKDLLGDGKLYSPENCCFISKKINQFMIDQKSRRGLWPIGVSWNKRDKCFKAQINNPFTNKNECLGNFTDANAAHLTWVERKRELAVLLASEVENKIISLAIIEKYS